MAHNNHKAPTQTRTTGNRTMRVLWIVRIRTTMPRLSQLWSRERPFASITRRVNVAPNPKATKYWKPSNSYCIWKKTSVLKSLETVRKSGRRSCRMSWIHKALRWTNYSRRYFRIDIFWTVSHTHFRFAINSNHMFVLLVLGDLLSKKPATTKIEKFLANQVKAKLREIQLDRNIASSFETLNQKIEERLRRLRNA